MMSHLDPRSLRRLVLLMATTLGLGGPASATEGVLLIGGGGGLPDAVIERFVELAGGEAAKLVVIPTASGSEPVVDRIVARWRARGVGSVTVSHTRDREAADSEGFVEPLQGATAVWMSGGAQSRLADAYVGTAVERGLQALVQRGGVVGGSSAGAAIQSKFMIARGNPRPEFGVGLGLVHGVVIDQHFLARNRMDRLLTAVRRRPGLIGVGIDEGTAIEVRSGRATVLGDSYVVVVAPLRGDEPMRIDTLSAGESFSMPDAESIVE